MREKNLRSEEATDVDREIAEKINFALNNIKDHLRDETLSYGKRSVRVRQTWATTWRAVLDIIIQNYSDDRHEQSQAILEPFHNAIDELVKAHFPDTVIDTLWNFTKIKAGIYAEIGILQAFKRSIGDSSAVVRAASNSEDEMGADIIIEKKELIVILQVKSHSDPGSDGEFLRFESDGGAKKGYLSLQGNRKLDRYQIYGIRITINQALHNKKYPENEHKLDPATGLPKDEKLFDLFLFEALKKFIGDQGGELWKDLSVLVPSKYFTNSASKPVKSETQAGLFAEILARLGIEE